MGTYIVLLRGINVSGQKLIKMDALKQSLSKLNVQNISTYVQSGNVVFKSESNSSELSNKPIKPTLFWSSVNKTKFPFSSFSIVSEHHKIEAEIFL